MLGTVETPESWLQLHREIAARGGLLATSVGFSEGDLPGAPLAATKGHFVLVLGMNADEVVVNDPAAPSDAEVRRSYPLAAFDQACRTGSGACFAFLPDAA